MLRKKLIISLAVIFLLVACSDQEKLALVLDSYVDYSADDLMTNFGHPQDTIEQGSNKIYHYSFFRRVYNPSTGFAYGAGSYGRGSRYLGPGYVGMGSYSIYECNISFLVDPHGTVKSWNKTGNSCARYAKRKLINPQFITELPKFSERVFGFKYKKTRKGIKVTKIFENSLAYKNGLRKGDIIQSINSKDISKLPIEFADDQLNYNEEVTVAILREGEKSLIKFPRTKMQKLELYPKSLKKFLGFEEG